MIDLFIALLTFYLLIIVGYIFGRFFKRYNEKIRRSLSFILLFILSPPLILLAFLLPNQSLNSTVISAVIVFQLILVSSTQFIAYLFFLRKREEEQNQRKGSILSLVAFPNAFLFPLPIILSLFGSEYIIILVIFSLSALVLRSTLLTYQCIYYGKENLKTFKQNLKEMLTFPPTITLIISVILNIFGIRLNQVYFLTINTLISRITSVIGAIFIGVLLVNINFTKIRIFQKDFSIVFFIRVVFSLFLFIIIIRFLTFLSELGQIILVILLLLYVNPPAVTNISYAEYFQLDHDFSAFCVFTITILAIIYIPLIIILGLTIF